MLLFFMFAFLLHVVPNARIITYVRGIESIIQRNETYADFPASCFKPTILSLSSFLERRNNIVTLLQEPEPRVLVHREPRRRNPLNLMHYLPTGCQSLVARGVSSSVQWVLVSF